VPTNFVARDVELMKYFILMPVCVFGELNLVPIGLIVFNKPAATVYIIAFSARLPCSIRSAYFKYIELEIGSQAYAKRTRITQMCSAKIISIIYVSFIGNITTPNKNIKILG
jgi:hypothetical protein